MKTNYLQPVGFSSEKINIIGVNQMLCGLIYKRNREFESFNVIVLIMDVLAYLDRYAVGSKAQKVSST